MDEFKTQKYPFDIFFKETLENIELCAQFKFNTVRPREKENVINPLVDIFLLNLPEEDKKTLNQIYTRKTDPSPLQNIKNVLIEAPITQAIFKIISCVKELYKS